MKMKFSALAAYFEELEKTSSRLKITDILADLFKNSDKSEIDKIIYLSLGILAPSFKGIVFNAADQMIIRAIAKAYEVDIEKVKNLYKQKGDLGLVSYELSKNKSTNLEVTEVYNQLLSAAQESGEGSQERRVDKIAEILRSVDPLSAKFITRIPVGKLRLGFSEKTIIDALSIAKVGDKSMSAKLKKSYEVMPDIGKLAQKMPTNPHPILGTPVVPMLAQRLNSPGQMLEKMGKVAVEPKFDGLRVQIHFKRNSLVCAFTRNLHDITLMFPELEKLGEFTASHELILDSESIGIDEKTLANLDFQMTMSRRRKHDIENFAKSIPLKFCVFDVLYKDGENLMDFPYDKRRVVLNKLFKDNSIFQVVENIITDDPKVIEEEYKKQLKNGLEGIMVKKVDSTYVPGRTGWRWVKMKQQESAQGKLTDTVDCIVMGYTVGKGKRTSFGIGQFLVGVLDASTGEIKTVTKVGTGLTDQEFHELKARLQKLTVKEKPKNYLVNKILEPDYWVIPELVVELAADDITKSPNHTAGFALRFPRLVKFRDDKDVKSATTVKEIEKLYKLQK